jgi:trimethylamine--corrinoid protein Co-methyltransferase
MMTLMPTFLSGTNFVMHSAGWLEGGLVSSIEKYVIDVQLLEMLQHEFTPLEIDEGSMAFDAHQEIGHGGHFLGAMHTMERFRDCFYRPFLSSSDNFERWTRNGSKDTATRAGEIAEEKLAAYEEPAMDDALKQELQEFISRRRTELGD